MYFFRTLKTAKELAGHHTEIIEINQSTKTKKQKL